MIGIVLTGHNKFAEGLFSSVTMIAGAQDQFECVNFLEGTNPDDLMIDIKEAVTKVNSGDGVIILTDLKGGSPFIQSCMAIQDMHDVEVIAGTNIGMLLEATLSRFMETDLKSFSNSLITSGKDSVYLYEEVVVEEDDSKDGI